jgi:hypothetical protein
MVSKTSGQGLNDRPSDRTKPTITKCKVKHFVKLYERIKLFTGTYTKADELCNISSGIAWFMKNEGLLTTDVAEKILTAYNKLIK